MSSTRVQDHSLGGMMGENLVSSYVKDKLLGMSPKDWDWVLGHGQDVEV